MKNIIFTTVCALVSATAYFYSVDFHTVWWLTWLAPIPLLLVIKRTNLLTTIVVCFTVGMSTCLSTIVGYSSTVIPFSSNIEPGIIAGMQFALLFTLTRYGLQRNHHWHAIFIFPIVASLIEWALSFSTLGTYQTFAYNQLFFLPVVQIASIGGYIAVTFTMSLFASTISYLLSHNDSTKQNKLTAGIVGLSIVALVLLFGVSRLAHEQQHPSDTITVGLVYHGYPITTLMQAKKATSIASKYASGIKKLAHQGAKIIMLPEESLTTNALNNKAVIDIFSRLSRDNHVQLIVGANQRLDHTYNSAWLFANTGELVGIYRKHHFVPGVELGMTAGKTLLSFHYNQYRFAIAICRDLDYVHPSADYGRQNVNVLFAPAWDFDVDAWVHGRMGVMRAVEYGFSLVRAARGGYLHAVSYTGRHVDSVFVANRDQQSIVINVPISHHSSVYANHPWLFPMTLLFLLVLLSAHSILASRGRVHRD